MSHCSLYDKILENKLVKIKEIYKKETKVTKGKLLNNTN